MLFAPNGSELRKFHRERCLGYLPSFNQRWSTLENRQHAVRGCSDLKEHIFGCKNPCRLPCLVVWSVWSRVLKSTYPASSVNELQWHNAQDGLVLLRWCTKQGLRRGVL